ncbi:DUF551 domain-containing protein [Cronobacter sakazakii]|uniref:DUF551 domain-containing protein n=1 Tax=Cronobacter sakazakii TaxID=28141 RepID=UPI0009B71A90|nr:DUF551 domain-containing protein [Cronobacter sakazakii]
MTFTKEQLIAAAHGRIDFANMMLSDNPEPLKERTWSIELELARIALSALRERADPVAVVNSNMRRICKKCSASIVGYSVDGLCEDCYLAAAPAPVTAGWIACSERMPEVGDIVLTADNGGVNVGEMEHSGASYRYFTSVVSGRELPATHWMPLPEAPTKN